MTRSIMRSAALAMAVMLVAVGCGGSAPSANDPAGTVTAALDAARSGGFGKLADYVCAAKKSDITTLFGGSGAGSLTALGIDTNALFDAMKIDFQEVKATETSKTATNATVHLTGKATTTFDATKMKPIIKQILTSQGAPADDASVDIAMNAMAGSLSSTQSIDEDVQLTQEGGKWLICQ